MKKAVYPGYLLISFFFFLTLHLTFFQRFYRNSSDDAIIKIARGDNLTSVASKLESGQVIFNKILFIAVGKVLGYQNNIIPGEYKFSNGLTNLDILKLITNPEIERRYTITIPEGLTIKQIGRLLKKNYNLDSAAFVNQSGNDSLLIEYGIKSSSMEGFLFPDTYELDVSAGSNPERRLINLMFDNFRRKLSKELLDKIKLKGLKLKDSNRLEMNSGLRYMPDLGTAKPADAV